MATFDFVSGDSFRAALESDYREMCTAMDSHAWKAAHVLAGSIIEAVLVDYLVATDYQSRTSSDPLKMTLDALIKACKDEGILGERAYNLSSVVKDYRNLIHPGRLIRLRERADESGAQVARALVEIIIADVANTRQEKFGYTAEQVLTKLQQDATALPYFEHILRRVQPSELERLLIALPQRYLDFTQTEEEANLALSALPQYFRPAFESASEDVKARIVRRFVRMIQEEGQATLDTYANSFFWLADMAYLSLDEISLVLKYWLSLLNRQVTGDPEVFYSNIEGLGPFLTPSDAEEFADMAVKFMFRRSRDDKYGLDHYRIYEVWFASSSHAQSAMKSRLQAMERQLDMRGREGEAKMVRDLNAYLSEIDPDNLPF